MNALRLSILTLLLGLGCSATPPERPHDRVVQFVHSFRVEIDGETVAEPRMLVRPGEEASVSILDEAGRALSIEIDGKGSALCTVPIVDDGRTVGRPQLLLEPGGSATWESPEHRVEVTSTVVAVPEESDGAADPE